MIRTMWCVFCSAFTSHFRASTDSTLNSMSCLRCGRREGSPYTAWYLAETLRT